jgi:hypothetical protein
MLNPTEQMKHLHNIKYLDINLKSVCQLIKKKKNLILTKT